MSRHLWMLRSLVPEAGLLELDELPIFDPRNEPQLRAVPVSRLASDCWKCGATAVLLRDPNIEGVGFCGRCVTRFEKPHNYEDLGEG